MNPLRELKLNQPGRIETVGEPSRRGCDGTVRHLSKDAISLELPEDAPSTFHVGQKVTFKYWDVFGLHRGETSVTAVTEGHPRELSVARPDHVELTQKRKFFRVHVTVPVTLVQSDGHLVHTLTEDLTPAGMRIVARSSLAAGDEVVVRIDFGSVGSDDAAPPVQTLARVVRVTPTGDGCAVSFEFAGIAEADQVRISLLLFELQRRVTQ